MMKRTALFVGVNDYEDGRIFRLACAEADASDLASLFRVQLKFDRVETLRNPGRAGDEDWATGDWRLGRGRGRQRS